MPSYSDLLKDPRWQKKRLKKLEAADWHCESCFDNSSMLSVHHKRYVKGRMPWEYPDEELAVLCQSCHEDMHRAADFRSDLIARLDVDGPNSVYDFVAHGAGAVSYWMADEVLSAMLLQIEAERPYQFHSGRVALHLGHTCRLTREGMLHLSDKLIGDDSFATDLLAFFRSHGIETYEDGRH
jgi:hypothetical protein